jgi:hypothetical protein
MLQQLLQLVDAVKHIKVKRARLFWLIKPVRQVINQDANACWPHQCATGEAIATRCRTGQTMPLLVGGIVGKLDF